MWLPGNFECSPPCVFITRTPFLESTPLLPSGSHCYIKARETDLCVNSPQEQALHTDKIRGAISPAEVGLLLCSPGLLQAVCLLSQAQNQRHTEGRAIMGVLKTCPFLPSPGQYLQGRHANKQTFFSFKSPAQPGSSSAT